MSGILAVEIGDSHTGGRKFRATRRRWWEIARFVGLCMSEIERCVHRAVDCLQCALPVQLEGPSATCPECRKRPLRKDTLQHCALSILRLSCSYGNRIKQGPAVSRY